MSDLFDAYSAASERETVQQRTRGPYVPPERPYYVCGELAWTWDGEGYVCAGVWYFPRMFVHSLSTNPTN